MSAASASVGDEHLGAARLDQRRRQRSPARDVEGQPRMGEIGSRAVQPDESRGVAARIAGSRRSSSRGAGQPERQVQQRREQHEAGGMGDVGLQQQVDGEVPARGVAGDDDSVGSEAAFVDEPVPAGADIVCGGGEAMPRGQPVVDAEHGQPGQPGQPGGQPAVGARSSTARSRCRGRSRWPWCGVVAGYAWRRAPIHRPPGGRRRGRTSTGSTPVPASDGPKVSMIRATICRDAHSPHARSGGRTALICRSVRLLTVAAPRDRSEPARQGICMLVIGHDRVHHQMVTFVNVNSYGCRSPGRPPVETALAAPSTRTSAPLMQSQREKVRG